MAKFVKQSGFVTTLLLVLIAALALLLVGGLTFPSKEAQKGSVPLTSSYTCCDSGDGEACKTSATEKFTWKGTNAQPEEYALIKSNIALKESGHLGPADPPDDKTPNGDRIVLNLSRNPHPECAPTDMDLVWKGNQCQGILNDEIIYVCKTNCEGSFGEGKFDAYFRVKDGPIPDSIKNCEKPKDTSGGSSAQDIICPTNSAKQNLQLQTCKIVEKVISASWLSPYCKPAIYLYPEEISYVSVRVSSSKPLTYSDPLYPINGWGVIANPLGEIFYRNKPYDYLYYETKVADSDIKKPSEGFVVEKGELKTLFANILPKLGLNFRESKQFSEYWLTALPESPYYFVGIVDPLSLESLSTLSINPVPKTVIRVTLYFKPLKEKIEVSEPVIVTIKRDGFTVVEWGGIYKKHPDESFSCFL